MLILFQGCVNKTGLVSCKHIFVNAADICDADWNFH
jgi:hypothetical protein